MPKWYKKISWIVSGLMMGAIVAGLIDQNFIALLIGAGLGLAVAGGLKLSGWLRRRAELKKWERYSGK